MLNCPISAISSSLRRQRASGWRNRLRAWACCPRKARQLRVRPIRTCCRNGTSSALPCRVSSRAMQRLSSSWCMASDAFSSTTWTAHCSASGSRSSSVIQACALCVSTVSTAPQIPSNIRFGCAARTPLGTCSSQRMNWFRWLTRRVDGCMRSSMSTIRPKSSHNRPWRSASCTSPARSNHCAARRCKQRISLWPLCRRWPRNSTNNGCSRYHCWPA
ncbi:hypothetical protein D3C80_1528070 [compost metagenome]